MRGQAAARVGDVQEHELDARLRSRLDRGPCLVDAEVVELADRGVARRAHLAVPARVRLAHERRRLPFRLGQHLLAPRPEVAAAGAPAQRALERVAVGVDEAGEHERRRHPSILAARFNPRSMATSAVSAPLAQLPNALTILRLALIPVFVAVYLAAGDGSSWAAGWIFLVAGVTDQVDGFLARRWRVESRFGKLADPLADRLMIDAAVILLWLEGKLPWPGRS